MLIAIGEVKATRDAIGLDQLDRLDAAAGQLLAHPPTGVTTTKSVRRLLFSRSGFTADLVRQAHQRADTELVDLHRLYHGS